MPSRLPDNLRLGRVSFTHYHKLPRRGLTSTTQSLHLVFLDDTIRPTTLAAAAEHAPPRHTPSAPVPCGQISAVKGLRGGLVCARSEV